MKITEAYVQINAEIDRSSADVLERQAAKLGEQMGRNIGDKMTDGVGKFQGPMRREGERLGSIFSHELQQKLEKLKVPDIKIDVDPREADKDIADIQKQLRILAEHSPDIQIRLDANEALQDVDKFAKKFTAKAKDTGKESGDQIGSAFTDSLQDRLKRLNLPDVKMDADFSQTHDKIEDLQDKLEKISRDAPTIGMKLDADRALVQLRQFRQKIGDEAEEAGEDAGDRASGGFRRHFDLDKGGMVAHQFSILSSRMAILTAAAITAAPAIAGLTAALAPLAGLMLTLPALTIAAGGAVAVFSLMFKGLEEVKKAEEAAAAAVEEYEKAMRPVALLGKEVYESTRDLVTGFVRGRVTAEQFAAGVATLPPEVQKAIPELVELNRTVVEAEAKASNMSPTLKKWTAAMKDVNATSLVVAETVRKGLFPGLLDAVYDLNKVLPRVQDNLGYVGKGFGDIAAAGARTVVLDKNLRTIDSILLVFASHLQPFVPVIEKLVQAFFDVGKAGTSAFGRLLEWVTKVTEGFAEWLSEAARSGDVGRWIAGGIRALKDLWSVIKPVIDIFITFGEVASATGKSTLQVLGDLLTGVANFLKSFEGRAALEAFFLVIRQLGTVLATLLTTALPPLAIAFAQIVTAVLPLLPLLSELIVILAPVLVAVTQLAAQLVEYLMPVLIKFTQWLVDNPELVKAIAVAILAVVVAVKALTIAQTLLAAAFAITPFGAIVIAIAALVAGFIYLWNTSSGFRDFWIATWEVIKTVALAVWDHIKFVIESWVRIFFVLRDAAVDVWHWLVTAFNAVKDAITTAFRAIGDAATWLWEHAIRPAFNAIAAVVRFVSGVFKSAWDFWSNIFSSLGNLIWYVGNVVIRSAFAAISDIIQWTWKNVIKPVVTAIAGAFTWLWREAIEPAINGIKIALKAVGDAAGWLWQHAIEPAAKGIWAAIKFIGDIAQWLWREAIKPAIDGIAHVFGWLHDHIIDPLSEKIGGAIGRIGQAFRDTFNGIKGFVETVFGGIGDAIKGVINGVIFVINKGVEGANKIISTINAVPGVNFPHIGYIPYLAKGGTAVRGGAAIVGENGPELLQMPRGASVIPLPRADGLGGGDASRKLDELIKTVKGNRPAVNIENATFETTTDADLVLQRLAGQGSF